MEILGVDGRQVTSWRDVNMRLLERTGEQGTIALEVSRDGARGTVSAPLNGWSLGNDEPNPLAEFGIMPWRPDVPAVLGQLTDDGRAMAANLQPGDRVAAVDGEPVANWFALVEIIQQAPEQRLLLTVERAGQTLRSEERRVGKECRSRWSRGH